MDMLDIENNALYFEEPLKPKAQECIDKAAEAYAPAPNSSSDAQTTDDMSKAEQLLMRAFLLEPEHPLVLVALYRFFYYQHRLEDALIIAERVLNVFAQRLDWPLDWRELSPEHLGDDAANRMNLIRFYLLALKGAGVLQLRLGETKEAIERLEKVAELDEKDRLGVKFLLEVAERALIDEMPNVERLFA